VLSFALPAAAQAKVKTYTPLTGAKPLADGATVDLRDVRFNPGHVSVQAGASLTWRFQDAIPHNVLLANGPITPTTAPTRWIDA
jgi:plastocyanin